MPPLALLRFSSLGDVASALRVAADARRQWPERRIVFVTHARYAVVARHLAVEGVEIIAFGEAIAGIPALAAALRAMGAEVVDLHRSLRTTLLMGQTPTLKWSRITKQRRARRALLRGDASGFAEDSRVQRHQAEVAGVALSDQPWLRASAEASGPLVLVPGAAWPEKRWPIEHFAALARRLSERLPVTLLYASGDEIDVDGQDWGATELAVDLDLEACIRRIAGARAVLSNDTGFAHIAEGLGVPTRVLLGPTDQRMGAAPQGSGGKAKVIRLGLPCQPCSQKGDRPCHVGGRPCMTELHPTAVLSELAPLLDRR